MIEEFSDTLHQYIKATTLFFAFQYMNESMLNNNGALSKDVIEKCYDYCLSSEVIL